MEISDIFDAGSFHSVQSACDWRIFQACGGAMRRLIAILLAIWLSILFVAAAAGLSSHGIAVVATWSFGLLFHIFLARVFFLLKEIVARVFRSAPEVHEHDIAANEDYPRHRERRTREAGYPR